MNTAFRVVSDALPEETGSNQNPGYIEQSHSGVHHVWVLDDS